VRIVVASDPDVGGPLGLDLDVLEAEVRLHALELGHSFFADDDALGEHRALGHDKLLAVALAISPNG
jgi:hypothetical protein